jgi:hypothetical protein
MSTDIQQLGRENSYGTVIGGKGLVQLSHLPTDARILLNQVDADSHVAEVERGLHSRYAAADNEHFI